MVLISVAVAFLSNTAQVPQSTPTPTIARAAFVLQGPNGLVSGAVTYQYVLYQPGQAEPVLRRGESEVTGVFTLPDLDAAEGRIELWAQTDDGKAEWLSGYLSVSYAKDALETADPPVVRMTRGMVVTGKVLSATDQQPLAKVEVAPMYEGQYGLLYEDWSRATTTGPMGEYRLTGSYIEGIATRSTGSQTEFSFAKGTSPQAAVLKVTPPITREIRVVDAHGNAVANATARSAVSPTGKDGVLNVLIREGPGRVLVSAHGFESEFVELPKPTELGPLTVRLKPVRPIRGRIQNADGSVPEKLGVWLKTGMGMLHQDYKSIRVHPDGTWEFTHWTTPESVSVSVVVGGVERAFHRFRIDGVDAGPGPEEPIELPVCPDVIVTTIGNGHNVEGRLVPAELVARYPGFLAVRLVDKDKQVVRAVRPDREGRFALYDVSDGEYEVEVSSFNVSARNSERRPGREIASVRQMFNDGSLQSGKPVVLQVNVNGDDVQLEPVRVTQVALLPGRIIGVAKTDEGQPLAHYFVYVNDGFSMDTAGGTHHVARGLTDRNGRFEVSGVSPGNYDVFIALSPRGYGGTVARCRTEVRSGKSASADPRFGDKGRKRRGDEE